MKWIKVSQDYNALRKPIFSSPPGLLIALECPLIFSKTNQILQKRWMLCSPSNMAPPTNTISLLHETSSNQETPEREP